MKPFTIQYTQPEMYRFSLDSIEAPLAVANWCVRQNMRGSLRVLDLCAGAGVMGLEFAFHCPQDLEIDFVEVQSTYESFFQENLNRMLSADRERGLKRDLQVRWLPMNYEKMLTVEFASAYDLILCNPPYFLPEQGRLSPSDFKNRCRFFLDSTPEKLCEVVAWVAKPGACAFVLMRPLKNHKVDLLQLYQKRFRYEGVIKDELEVRGTRLLQMIKQSGNSGSN